MAADPDEADIKDLELDWSQLTVDASTLPTRQESKESLAARAGNANAMTWSSKDKPNGSAAVSVKQAV